MSFPGEGSEEPPLAPGLAPDGGLPDEVADWYLETDRPGAPTDQASPPWPEPTSAPAAAEPAWPEPTSPTAASPAAAAPNWPEPTSAPAAPPPAPIPPAPAPPAPAPPTPAPPAPPGASQPGFAPAPGFDAAAAVFEAGVSAPAPPPAFAAPPPAPMPPPPAPAPPAPAQAAPPAPAPPAPPPQAPAPQAPAPQAPAPPAPAAPTGQVPHGIGSTDLPVRFERPPLTKDLLGLKRLAKESLIERLGPRLFDASLTEKELENSIIEELAAFLVENNTSYGESDLQQLSDELVNDILGHGPIEPFLDDESITEIMVNGTKSVFVERAGKLYETSTQFDSDDHIRQVIDRIVSRIGRRVDESSPMVDARLLDGSRVNAVIPPLAVDGPSLTIRKFAKRALDFNDLIAYGTLSRESCDLLEAFVRGRLNILVSGGTGSGKTTLLNVLSNFIPDGERIVTIEDAVELRLNKRHIVRLESRPPNLEGKGAIMIRDLVRNSLRMRPDRIVVGECRGGETLDMLQAMNTGHDGSLSTLHANTPRDAISRVETMVMMAGMDLPIRAIREQVASAVDIIVQLSRLRDGSRRVTHVTEVVGMEGDTVTLSDIFVLDVQGMDEGGRYIANLRPTGLRPMVLDKLADEGIELDPGTFGDIGSGGADLDFSAM